MKIHNIVREWHNYSIVTSRLFYAMKLCYVYKENNIVKIYTRRETRQ